MNIHNTTEYCNNKISEAVIGFTKRAYDVIENEDAVIEVGFASGSATDPVTVT